MQRRRIRGIGGGEEWIDEWHKGRRKKENEERRDVTKE